MQGGTVPTRVEFVHFLVLQLLPNDTTPAHRPTTQPVFVVRIHTITALLQLSESTQPNMPVPTLFFTTPIGRL